MASKQRQHGTCLFDGFALLGVTVEGQTAQMHAFGKFTLQHHLAANWATEHSLSRYASDGAVRGQHKLFDGVAPTRNVDNFAGSADLVDCFAQGRALVPFGIRLDTEIGDATAGRSSS